MGRANKARRAAKQRQAARDRADGRAEPAGAAGGRDDLELFCHVAARWRDGADPAGLDALLVRPPEGVAMAASAVLEPYLALVWDGGWTPADLARAARRHVAAPVRDVLAAAARSQSRTYEALGNDVAPAWMAELDAMPGPRPAPTPAWLLGLASTIGWRAALEAALDAVALVEQMGKLPPVLPAPSSWRVGGPVSKLRAGQVDDKLLRRVRALLAQAESTDFEEEAATFTAKAQELMARYRIDRALLFEDASSPVDCMRVAVDDPYAAPKAILLAVVARANGCRAVFHQWIGASTLFGRPGDMEVVELLFTSLLVQATRAMRVASETAAWGKRSFRQSFLTGFTNRIAVRLDEGVAAAVADAEVETGSEVLPVLARNDELVEEALDAACPGMRPLKVSVSNAAGYYAGVTAADQADITTPRDRLRAS